MLTSVSKDDIVGPCSADRGDLDGGAADGGVAAADGGADVEEDDPEAFEECSETRLIKGNM